MEQPKYDESEWPLVVITMPVDELNDSDLLRHLDRMSAFSQRGRHAQVIDVRTASQLSARARRLVAERMDQDEEAYPDTLVGVAIVLSSALHRGIFKAISWLSRNPRPFEAFSDLEVAKAWGHHLIRARPVGRPSIRAPGP